MRVKNATWLGTIFGILIGAIALGFVEVKSEARTLSYSAAWWIVVITTGLPLLSLLQDKQAVIGAEGGFINGLGTGLGLFLLIVGKAI